MKSSDPQTNRAFNLGSDARIQGRPLNANPYASDASSYYLWMTWREGWLDVEEHWGERNPGAKPLPFPGLSLAPEEQEAILDQVEREWRSVGMAGGPAL